jgi:hypothetical protein
VTDGEIEDYAWDWGDPTAVSLAAFSATSREDGVLVSWETATELDNAGFNLYRSTAADGEYIKLNAALIPPRNPGGNVGATYAWTDKEVEPGATYFYKLEDLDINGTSTFHGPVGVTADAVEPTSVEVAALDATSRPLAWPLLAVLTASLLGALLLRKRRTS